MSEIDWSKAPEGATHWDSRPHADATWMRPNHRPGRGWDYWGIGGHWIYYGSMSVEQEAQMIARPVDLNWNGEGLPPVGTVCEIRNVAAGASWAKATIVFASRNVVTWDWAGEPAINGLCTAYAHAVEMRPVRTPEQIAAEARKQAIKQMISDTHILAGTMSNRQLMAEQLYDAGYRKQEAS